MNSILKVIHNAGFFSNCSVKLQDIMIYFNQNKGLPDVVDSSLQFLHYKKDPVENLIPYYFQEDLDYSIPYTHEMVMTHDKRYPQFSDYRLIEFKDVTPFLTKYFAPSITVGNIVYNFTQSYNLDFDNLCAVFYRGNDKNRETTIAPYEFFLDKAREVKAQNPNIKFLVQPDETEFLEAFLKVFPEDTIYFKETPHMPKQDSCMFFELPQNERKEYGAKFFAAVLCLSKCKHIITHSGNGSFWCTLYRGNTDNVHQILHNQWLS